MKPVRLFVDLSRVNIVDIDPMEKLKSFNLL